MGTYSPVSREGTYRLQPFTCRETRFMNAGS